MICPKCGGKIKTNDVLNKPDTNEVYRKRVCTSCDHYFYTIEFEVEDNPQFQKEWKAARSAKNHVNWMRRKSRSKEK